MTLQFTTFFPQNMLPQIRLKAGLGYPPMPYYTNVVESKNKILKDEISPVSFPILLTR